VTGGGSFISERPLHAPYDGSSKPFTIGLKPLDPAEWIEVDEKLDAYLEEKDRLYASVPEKVFAAQPDTVESQRQVLDLLVEHLPSRFPGTYRLVDGRVEIAAGDRSVDLAEESRAPLLTASRLVQEDLVLMRKGEDGWRLAAASLCFPSSWSLTEKFGRALDDIHVPVPGFGRGSRTAGLITRIFDNLKVGQPVLRLNWSLQTDRELHKPLSGAGRTERAATAEPRFPGNAATAAFIRVERQTLRKLPASGDILFTIRIHLDPMTALKGHPERAALAASFAAQLDALDAAQLDYKGLAADRTRLAEALRKVAAD
jgi:hypothetical protein